MHASFFLNKQKYIFLNIKQKKGETFLPLLKFNSKTDLFYD